jgi:hypothetical protein
MMSKDWYVVVGHDEPSTQGDIIVDCPLLKWRSPENGSDGLPVAAGQKTTLRAVSPETRPYGGSLGTLISAWV